MKIKYLYIVFLILLSHCVIIEPFHIEMKSSYGEKVYIYIEERIGTNTNGKPQWGKPRYGLKDSSGKPTNVLDLGLAVPILTDDIKAGERLILKAKKISPEIGLTGMGINFGNLIVGQLRYIDYAGGDSIKVSIEVFGIIRKGKSGNEDHITGHVCKPGDPFCAN